MPLTLYVPARSVLHRLHPVTKGATLLVLVLSAFLVDQPLLLLPIAALAVTLGVVAGAGSTLWRFRWMFVLVFAFTLLVWTFFYRTVLTPSWPGFLFGLSTAIRLSAFLAAGLYFLSTTRIEEIAYALGCVGVPYVAGFTLTLSFRLVPVFFDAAFTIAEAQRCRGLDLQQGGVVRRLRGYAAIIVPVLIGALRRADRMAMALELRGFGSHHVRTTHRRAAAGAIDVVAALAGALLAAVYVILWWRGYGAIHP